MDKNINDNDRIIIGVREWAVHEATTIHYDLLAEKLTDASALVETATKLEEYVVREILNRGTKD